MTRTKPFKMPVLAIRLSGYINGVSKLHGQISREVWGSLWPGVPEKEVPIISITNGIHMKTWLADEMGESVSALSRARPGRRASLTSPLWDPVDQIPDEELWSVHQRCKEAVDCVRAEAVDGADAASRPVPRRACGRPKRCLDPEALDDWLSPGGSPPTSGVTCS